MNILITGGGGFIGSHLMRALLSRGHRITACVRDPRRATRDFRGPTYIACDFRRDTQPAVWHPRLAGIDVVINAVGIIRETGSQSFDALHRDAPIALFQAAADCGVGRVIQISALGADDTAHSHYYLSKRAADDYLARLPLAGAILRPSIVYGPGARSMALFRALAALPFTPLVGDGRQRVQPIHVDDLVRAVTLCVESDPPIRGRIDLPGAEPVTMLELLARLRHWLGLGRVRPLFVPYPIALRMAACGGFLGDAPVGREAVEMLQWGNTGDPTICSERLGFLPRSLTQGLAESVATQAERWHAGLYFLRPLLRITIALVWITAGVTSAFLYPLRESYALLAQVGIVGATAQVTLYAAAALDLLLGLAILFRCRLRTAAYAQVVIMLGYSLIISVALPEFWLHPFGPVSKNLPLLAGTLVMLVMERR